MMTKKKTEFHDILPAVGDEITNLSGRAYFPVFKTKSSINGGNSKRVMVSAGDGNSVMIERRNIEENGVLITQQRQQETETKSAKSLTESKTVLAPQKLNGRIKQVAPMHTETGKLKPLKTLAKNGYFDHAQLAIKVKDKSHRILLSGIWDELTDQARSNVPINDIAASLNLDKDDLQRVCGHVLEAEAARGRVDLAKDVFKTALQDNKNPATKIFASKALLGLSDRGTVSPQSPMNITIKV